ncbi:20399_t:CDS:2 [Dentiscutata erythropus]|uniref:Vacuolar calcium ion transporter n=1 Tax=Dentiscutata erythropus TaxID=1348616 RepID=A0A9N9BGS7_9GLOM|nr:20399_t:CDS:2 [Dentiscutata erythropus]
MNFLAIIPSAQVLRFANSEVSHHSGEPLGSLLNITSSNSVELIVTIIALINGQIRVVQATVLGSIFSHLLLVLGFCFLIGGIKILIKENKLEQEFSSTAAQMTSSVMTLACISLVLPSAFSILINYRFSNIPAVMINDKILHISYGVSIALLVIYLLYLCFTTKTHKILFKKYYGHKGEDSREKKYENEENEESREQRCENEKNGEQIDGGDKSGKHISLISSLILLIIMTAIIAISAKFLVTSIEGIVTSYNISKTFIALVLLPIVGNGAKYANAVNTASKNKMDTVLLISVGSSTQSALFITPLLVILGWIINQPMSLFFSPFETICLFISVILKNYLVQMGNQIGWKAYC